MTGLAADLRYAIRTLRLAPGFCILAIGILALGIGASVSVFTIVDGVLLRPLPYRNPGRLYALTSVPADPRFDSNGSLPYADFDELRLHCRSFSDMAVTYRQGWSVVTLTGEAEPEKAQGAFVSPGFFALIGLSPELGRTFTGDENRRGERVVVLSDGLAARRFGAPGKALGRDIEIGGIKWKVIGVMPPAFRVPFLDTQLWAPVMSHPEWTAGEEPNPQLRQRWDVIGRLKAGASPAAAQAEVNALEKRLKSELPEFHTDRVRVVPLRDHFTGKVRRPLLILLASVALLLLIACANVGNLLLARAVARDREFAIRAALGAGRFRLLRQVVAENALLALLGGATGVVLAVFLVPVLKALAPVATPRLVDVGIDARVLAFAVAITSGSALVLGFVPGWNAARRRMAEALNAPGRSATDSRRANRMKACLVVAEFAIAAVLLGSAVLLLRSFLAVLAVDPGFLAEHVLAVHVSLPGSTPPPQMERFYADILARIGALPGVESAGGVGNLFFLDEKRTHALRQVEGGPPEPRSAWKPLVWTQVTGAYFQAMGIPLLRGRLFDTQDHPDAPLVAIVNETLAHRYWPGEDPVGRRLKGFDPRGKNDDWITVVGVVKDSRSGGLERAPLAQIYEVQSQRGEQISDIVIRASGDPLRIATAARAAVRTARADAVVSSVQPLVRLLDEQERPRRFETWLIAAFSAIALSLAALGVFALMHYAVASKQRELGIRIAVGATARQILRGVVWKGVRLAVAGAGIGLITGFWITSALSSLLYQVKPGDPASFIVSTAVLLIVAAAGAYIPGRRATRVDPATVLRRE